MQNELQGTLNSLASVTSIAGPFLFSYLFSTFTGPQAPAEFPGAPYAAAAVMTVAALIIFVLKVRSRLSRMHRLQHITGIDQCNE